MSVLTLLSCWAEELRALRPHDDYVEGGWLCAPGPRLHMILAVCQIMFALLGVRLPRWHVVGDVFSHMATVCLSPARLAARARPNRSLLLLMGREDWGRYERGKRSRLSS